MMTLRLAKKVYVTYVRSVRANLARARDGRIEPLPPVPGALAAADARLRRARLVPTYDEQTGTVRFEPYPRRAPPGRAGETP